MKRKTDNIYFNWGVTAACVLLVCIAAYLILANLQTVFGCLGKLLSVLTPVLYGLAFGYLLCPLMNAAERLLRRALQHTKCRPKLIHRLSRGGGIVFALGVALLVVYAVIAMILPELTGSVAKLVEDLPSNYDKVVEWVTGLLADRPALEQAVSNGLDYLEKWLYSDLLPNAQQYLLSLTASMVSIVYGVVNLLIGVIVSVYVLISKDTFLAQTKKIVCAVLPAHGANRLMDVARQAHRIFGGFLTGKIIDSLIIGILCFIGMTIFNMPYALLVSVIVGVTNVIPFFGPYIGAVPSAFLILLVSPMQCLYFVLFIFALQQFDGNILGPHILGSATGLSGFWVVVSILLFGNLFGMVGMIIGVPTFAVIYSLISDLVSRGLRRREIDPETDFLNLERLPVQDETSEPPHQSV